MASKSFILVKTGLSFLHCDSIYSVRVLNGTSGTLGGGLCAACGVLEAAGLLILTSLENKCSLAEVRSNADSFSTTTGTWCKKYYMKLSHLNKAQIYISYSIDLIVSLSLCFSALTDYADSFQTWRCEEPTLYECLIIIR